MPQFSDLPTKAFLGSTGAAANSYVLINYEDTTTNAPVTYKASLQELGKAIANDLKLPSVTVNEGAITNFKVKGVSNGTYTETVVAAPYDGPSMGAISDTVDTAISGLASTGYVTNAVNGLASTGYVTNALSNYANLSSLDPSSGQVMAIINSHSLASEGYVTDAINTATNGLASAGDISAAIAVALSAASVSINPTASTLCEVYDPIQDSSQDMFLYPVMALHISTGLDLFAKSSDGNYLEAIGNVLTTDDIYNIGNIAYVGTSDAKPCIRDKNNVFKGFLSTT